MNSALKARSDGPPYNRNCADCLLQGTTNAPPSPAPRKVAIQESQCPNRMLAFLIPGALMGTTMTLPPCAAMLVAQ